MRLFNSSQALSLVLVILMFVFVAVVQWAGMHGVHLPAIVLTLAGAFATLITSMCARLLPGLESKIAAQVTGLSPAAKDAVLGLVTQAVASHQAQQATLAAAQAAMPFLASASLPSVPALPVLSAPPVLPLPEHVSQQLQRIEGAVNALAPQAAVAPTEPDAPTPGNAGEPPATEDDADSATVGGLASAA